MLTDFKTGASIGAGKLAARMREGECLQPAAYVLGAAGSAPSVRGRLLYLRDDVSADDVAVGLGEGGDDEWRASFGAMFAALLDAWRAGVFFPRLTQGDGERINEACKFCEVSPACLQHDSGARRRLRGLARGSERSPELDALRALWSYGRPAADAAATGGPRRGGRGRR